MHIKQSAPLLLVALAGLAGHFGSLCGVNETCPLWGFFYDHVFTVLDPLYIFSLFSIPAVLLLPIVKKRVFGAWLRFAFVWLLFSFVVIARASEPSSSWFQIIRFEGEDAARLMGILFSGLSLFLLAWQTFMPERIRNAPL